jgi:DNA replication protein DnaC
MTKTNSLNDKIEEQLKALKLKDLIPIYNTIIQQSVKQKLSYEEFLSLLLDHSLSGKNERSINAKIAKARFPFFKTIEQFDFSFQPALNEKEILQLSSLFFIQQKHNIIFLGPPGVGKTHLAIALGIKACYAKYRVLFRQAKDIILELMTASKDGSLIDKLISYSRLDLLIIDELGYMPIDNDHANLLFQLVSIRYEKASIILTSNYSLEDWNNIFDNNMVAAAIIDRLAHHSHLYLINGQSYRIKDKIKQ